MIRLLGLPLRLLKRHEIGMADVRGMVLLPDICQDLRQDALSLVERGRGLIMDAFIFIIMVQAVVILKRAIARRSGS